MILLDAYALVAFAGAEPAADEVEAVMRSGGVGTPTTALAEAADVLTRVKRIPAREVRDALEPLIGEVVRPLTELSPELAWRVAALRARHYDRRTSALSLADCILVAWADPGVDRVATADPPLAAACRAEGIDVIALPGSGGIRP